MVGGFMTYGELKNRVLELIFSYSVAGSQIPATYNNQADYIAMIPGLVNNGQMDIATSVKRIPAMALLSDLESEQAGERVLYRSLVWGGLVLCWLLQKWTEMTEALQKYSF